MANSGTAILLHFPSTDLQVAILRRGALQMGLPPAKLENCQNHIFYKNEFMSFGWSLRWAILLRGVLH